MTRHAYLFLNIAILAAMLGLCALFQGVLIDPAIAWLSKAPFARVALYWLAFVLFILWLISAPVWCWASMRRLRTSGYPEWWSIAPTALGFLAIVIVVLGGHLLGGDLRGVDAPLPPPSTGYVESGPPADAMSITWLLRVSGFLLTIGAAFTLAVIVVALGPERINEDDYTIAA